MELKGIKVQHKLFGKGEIIEQTEHSLTIRFADGTQRRMAYPQAFQMGLSAENPSVQKKLLSAEDTRRQSAEDALQERLSKYAEEYKPVDKAAEKERKAAEAKEKKAAEARERKEARTRQKSAEAKAKAEAKAEKKPAAKKTAAKKTSKKKEPEAQADA